jgi:hypothetical protein
MSRLTSMDLFVGLAFLGLALLNSSISQANQTSSIGTEQDDKWTVDYVTDTDVHASVNGQVTHGDKLIIRFTKDYCHTGNLLTTFYTVSDHPEVMKLKDKLIDVNFIGMRFKAKVIYVAPFLAGHRAMASLGWVKPGDLKRDLGKQNPITIALENSEAIASDEYFDINHNNWSNNNLSHAIDQAQEICRKL